MDILIFTLDLHLFNVTSHENTFVWSQLQKLDTGKLEKMPFQV